MSSRAQCTRAFETVDAYCAAHNLHLVAALLLPAPRALPSAVGPGAYDTHNPSLSATRPVPPRPLPSRPPRPADLRVILGPAYVRADELPSPHALLANAPRPVVALRLPCPALVDCARLWPCTRTYARTSPRRTSAGCTRPSTAGPAPTHVHTHSCTRTLRRTQGRDRGRGARMGRRPARGPRGPRLARGRLRRAARGRLRTRSPTSARGLYM